MNYSNNSSIIFDHKKTGVPPLLPKVDAILVLDGDGNRLAGKYYGDFLKTPRGDKTVEELRSSFEKSLQQKIAGIAARPDSAEVVTCPYNRTAVFCGGTIGGGGSNGDVRIVHVGPPTESELVLAHLCEGMYDALIRLMGQTDRTMVLDNLELVFLLIDEHCDGGIILETDGHKLAGAVMLRDDESAAMGGAGGEDMMMMQGGGGSGMPGGQPPLNAADMTIGQALRQAREQFMANMG